MKTAIEKIYYGETSEQIMPVTKEWKRLAALSSKVHDEFYASLNEVQKQQFDELYDYLIGQESEEVKLKYKEGFKLGLALAVEAFWADSQ